MGDAVLHGVIVADGYSILIDKSIVALDVMHVEGRSNGRSRLLYPSRFASLS